MDKEKKELSYWNEQLKNLSDSEKFIWDYCDEYPYKKSIYKEIFDKEHGNKLSNICKNNSLLIYTFLVSTLKITLSKYMGKNDIVIGMPCYSTQHNRGNVHINKLLPLVSYIDYEKTYLEYMDSIKTKVLGNYKNQAYLTSKILLQNGLPNDVFDLTQINVCMKELHEDKDINYICQSSKNELSFLLDPMKDNSIGIHIIYNSNKITESTVKAIYESYSTVLRDVVNDCNKKVKDIKILSEKKLNKILYEFNDTKADYPRDKTIHELFEEQVEKTPDNIAVVFEDKKLTYKELNERANSLARVLRNKGVKADSIVGIMVERSLEMIVGIMGILKSGGAYLPIDTNYPKERIEYMLKDSESKVILSKSDLVETIEFDGEIIDLYDENLVNKYSGNLEKINDFSNLAYIIYTSGTTGNPKGAMIEHRALVNRLNWMQKKYPITEKDTILQKTTYTFDVSVWEILWWSLVGAKVCMLTPNAEKDPMKIIETIDKYEVTTMHFVPSMLDVFLYCVGENKNNINLSSLRQVFSSGEALNFKQVSKFYKEFENGKKLINLYGPTEATIDVSYFDCCNDIKKIIPIGKPIDNTGLYILNNNDVAPIGVSGELYIGGHGLARGYVNRPELTAEKFVDNLFEPGTKMYKTGDLARWLPDGNIEFLGRIDNQVKIRGFRIELGEIENRLLQHENIKEAAVLVKENKDSEKYICAYVVSDKTIQELNLKGHLRETLPEYMVPAYFVELEKMPLTTNGKLDRRALPEPNLDATLTEYEAPRNEVEKALAKIWTEILAVERVGINDNFFDLGGHSLKATMLIAKIHKELNKEVPLKELFKSPTIKGISKFIESAEENFYSKIEKIEEKEYYEASSAQKRMYMLQQFDKDSIAYNMPAVFELEGKVDKNKIEETFRKLTQRHEALRTYFETLDGEIIQKLQNNYVFKLKYKNENGDIEDIINNFVRTFDLEKAPLLRVELVENKEKTYLLIDMHHIISDGLSMGILINEFSEIYSGKTLEPLKLQYKDFAAWQNNFLKSEEMKKQEEYWVNRFSDEIPVLNMPTDYERPAMQSFEGESISFEVDEDTTLKLKKLTKETGTTTHMALLSAFNILLSKYSGQEDIVIGTPIAGRPHADLQNIMGMFVNTLALRNKPEGSKKYIDFLKEVKENSLKVYENQSYQIETLVEKLDVRRDTSRNPLFDVMFNMDDTISGGGIRLDDITLKIYNNRSKISKFDMTLNVMESETKLSFNIEYCSKLFKKETIERLSGHYIRILNSIVNHREIKLCEIDLLSEAERSQILYEFNDTKADYPKDKTIHELFEAQVEKTPDNIALVFEENKLTYRELNERANSLAKVLRDKGVKADSIAGIMVERSLEMIVGIMAILKSGGAYLPIDPSYPKERIEYMLKDSGSNILLSKNALTENVGFNGEIIDLDNETLFNKESRNLEQINSSSDLAYIIYTSGTTGKPKGVAIEHKGIINLTDVFKKELNININTKILQFASIAFDASAWEMYMSILLGGELHIVSKNIVIDTVKLNDYIRNNDVNIVTLPPFIANEIKVNNSNLEVIITAGSEAKKSMVNKLGDRIKYINAYGPTEGTICTTLWNNKYNKYKTVPIGKPINNNKAYILNKNNRLLSIGIVGELCISGDGLARGYINRPELTAEKFVDNPFELGTKIYKTGDLARWLPDGNIEFVGRIDSQVKIRGFRIELGEIESILLEHENVREGAVLVKEKKNRGQYICAYVISDKKLKELGLRDYFKKILPEYMIPTCFVKIDKIPLTFNGKIDTKALPEPNEEMILTSYDAPTNKIEETLERIWSDVLGNEKLGINNSFFEVGGNSIDVIKATSIINETFNISMEIREFYELATIKNISSRITEKINDVSIEQINKKLNERFGQKYKIDRYKIEENEEIILYSDENYKEVLNYLRDNFNSSVYPDYVLPYNKLEYIKMKKLLTKEALYEVLEMKSIGERDIVNLLNRIELEMNKCKEKICNEKIIDIYKIGRVLHEKCKKAHLLGRKNCNNIIIPFNNLNYNNVKSSFIKLINNQDMLRTSMYLDGLEYKFVEHSHIDDIDFNAIDLSQYNYETRMSIAIRTFKLMNDSIKYTSSLSDVLYRCVIVKVSNKKYFLLLTIAHMICDNETTKIIKNYFDESLNNEFKSLPYKHFIKNYLVNDRKYEISLFDNSKVLKEYREATNLFNDNYRKYLNSRDKKIEISKPFVIEYEFNNNEKPSNNKNKSALEIAMYIVSNVLSIQFGIKKVPLGVLASRRVINENNYYFTIGNFNESVPCSFNTQSDVVYNYYDKYLYVYNKLNEYNIYLRRLKENTQWLNTLYINNPFSLNYLGDYAINEDKLVKPILSRRLSYPYPVQAYSLNSSILKISFINGVDDKNIEEIIKFLDKLDGKSYCYVDSSQ